MAQHLQDAIAAPNSDLDARFGAGMAKSPSLPVLHSANNLGAANHPALASPILLTEVNMTNKF